MSFYFPLSTTKLLLWKWRHRDYWLSLYLSSHSSSHPFSWSMKPAHNYRIVGDRLCSDDRYASIGKRSEIKESKSNISWWHRFPLTMARSSLFLSLSLSRKVTMTILIIASPTASLSMALSISIPLSPYVSLSLSLSLFLSLSLSLDNGSSLSLDDRRRNTKLVNRNTTEGRIYDRN